MRTKKNLNFLFSSFFLLWRRLEYDEKCGISLREAKMSSKFYFYNYSSKAVKISKKSRDTQEGNKKKFFFSRLLHFERFHDKKENCEFSFIFFLMHTTNQEQKSSQRKVNECEKSVESFNEMEELKSLRLRGKNHFFCF